MHFLRNVYHWLWAWVGNIIYGFPSRRLIVIGITGTKGKSTAVELTHAMFQAAGIKAAIISTVRLKLGDTVEENQKGNSMPGRAYLQKFLRRAVKADCCVAVIEVTSQGVLQHRQKFIDFDAAGLTNLSPEHIEGHGSFEKYRGAKVSFFESVAKASPKAKRFFFINQTCGDAVYFERAAQSASRKSTPSVIASPLAGARSNPENWIATVRQSAEPRDDKHNELFIVYFNGEEFLKTFLNNQRELVSEWLRPDFNLENAALAAAISQAFGVKREAILTVLKNFSGVPGRQEWVRAPGKPAVVIDYAHTPDSLRALYSYLKSYVIGHRSDVGASPRLICVLAAAGGGRDKWKRPEMGKVAAEFCDEIILTSEDPYDENPADICNEIAAGLKSQVPSTKYQTILDRKSAIQTAIKSAGESDIIAITGMGSQKWFYGPRGQKIPWNEREIVESALKTEI